VHTFNQHVEFLGKKVKREFMQAINDMGVQMIMQRVKADGGGVEQVCERVNDERVDKMGRYF
jgi:hypothetical protein